MNAHALLRPGVAGTAVALVAIAVAGGPAAAATGLVVRPGTSDGELLPHSAATSTFTVAATGRRVVIDTARVTGVDVRPAPGRVCPPGSVRAVVDDARRTTVDLRPAVFTVRLRLTPGAPTGCAGARLVPRVTVTGTDAAGHRVTGRTPPRAGSVVGPVRGEAMLAALPAASDHHALAALFAFLAAAAVLLFDPLRLARLMAGRALSRRVKTRGTKR